MNDWLAFYQNLPEVISPVLFRWGAWQISWYSFWYLLSFVVGGAFLLRKIKKQPFLGMRPSDLVDFLAILFLGAVVGGRLGYVLLYNPAFYWHFPLAIISPWNDFGQWVGIYGLSYHGGLLGVILAALGYARHKQWGFWSLADWAMPAVPLGYFFGRLGNFFNGELYGRITDKWWGMYFEDGEGNLFLRHPSQIYEAVGEGLLLFIILYWLSGKKIKKGTMLPAYLFGYGAIRFFLEYFREPDDFLGFFWGNLTLGQYYSLVMIGVALVLKLVIYRKRKMVYNEA